MALKGTHNIKDFAISFGGALLSGFSQDAAVTIEYQNERHTTEFGIDGEATRMRNNADLYAVVTVSLMNSSSSNGSMQLVAELDRLAGGGVVPMTIVHAKGGEKYVADEAYIQKQPDAEIGQGPTAREWMIECPELKVMGYGLGSA